MSIPDYPVLLDINDHEFPSIELALDEPNGLLAFGGDLSSERLITAYQQGIFPWFSDGEPIMWWSPNPRSVIFPQQFKASKSLQKQMNKNIFSCSINTHFAQVIEACATVTRKGQPGTWITDEMKQAYILLHQQGIAHSFECWQNEQLVGGLYGLKLGEVFFGESMFSLKTNASKIAFAYMVNYALENDIKMIDCQVESEHMNSLGAKNIPRLVFKKLLQKYIAQNKVHKSILLSPGYT